MVAGRAGRELIGTLIIGGGCGRGAEDDEPSGGALEGLTAGVTELKKLSKSASVVLVDMLLCRLATPRACGAANGGGNAATDDTARTGISGVNDRVLNALTGGSNEFEVLAYTGLDDGVVGWAAGRPAPPSSSSSSLAKGSKGSSALLIFLGALIVFFGGCENAPNSPPKSSSGSPIGSFPDNARVSPKKSSIPSPSSFAVVELLANMRLCRLLVLSSASRSRACQVGCCDSGGSEAGSCSLLRRGFDGA